MTDEEKSLREAIVAQCRHMNATGLNQGTSGNIAARLDGAMLITPSAVPYDQMTPAMIARMPLDGSDDWQGPRHPSSEWRFHRDILRARADAHAVIHTHPIHCTALAMARRGIPAAHYMVAAFGGADVRCGRYATFGTQALSDAAVEALEGRNACLLANHGMIAVGPTLDRAMWLAEELETLARQYILSLQIGGPVILSDAQIDETLAAFEGYGRQ